MVPVVGYQFGLVDIVVVGFERVEKSIAVAVIDLLEAGILHE